MARCRSGIVYFGRRGSSWHLGNHLQSRLLLQLLQRGKIRLLGLRHFRKQVLGYDTRRADLQLIKEYLLLGRDWKNFQHPLYFFKK